MAFFKFLLIIILLLPNSGSDDFQLIKTIKVEADNFEVDHLGNIYLIRSGTLTKLDSQGKKQCQYTNPLLGTISSVDVSNPFRILVFFREANQFVFLNNTLAELASPIVFDDYGYFSVGAVCVSTQNRIWIFDVENLQLVQLDQNMGEVQKTPTIDQIIDTKCVPNILFEKQNQVYLNCPDYGMIVFGQFGSLSKKFPKPNIQTFNAEGSDFLYQQDSKIFRYSKLSLQENEVFIPGLNPESIVRFTNRQYFVLSKTELKLYE